MDLRKIIKPTILLDEAKCRRNIMRMAEKAKVSGVAFRPHFKTHQSAEIGKWFSETGVDTITVSSVTMAKYFADAGWNDITIAFPLNIREISDANSLSKSVNLNILISDNQQAEIICNISSLNAGYFIKINTGNNRSGFEWDDHIQIKRIIDKFHNKKSIRFAGFLTHSGHTYKAQSTSQIIDIYYDTLNKFSNFTKITSDDTILSTGDTPSCSLIDNFKGFDEIRPGNFVFYDLMQYFLGSCTLDDISIIVACPVVEKNLKRNEIVIYGGGVHLSKDYVKSAGGKNVYGKAVILNDNGWTSVSEDDYLKALSQEHGIISSSDVLFKSVKVGDLVGIIPVHSCMTVDLLRQYCTYDGEIITDFSPK